MCVRIHSSTGRDYGAVQEGEEHNVRRGGGGGKDVEVQNMASSSGEG